MAGRERPTKLDTTHTPLQTKGPAEARWIARAPRDSARFVNDMTRGVADPTGLLAVAEA